MLRETNGQLEVQLPPAIPVDEPFELVSWVPSDVADVSAVYWRSGKGNCERDDLDPFEEPVLPLRTRFETTRERRVNEQRVVVTVPKLSQPWWEHCFRLSFWRRSYTGSATEPVQFARFASELDGEDGGISEATIRTAAVRAGLFDQETCNAQRDWADKLSCERTLNEAAAGLASSLAIKRVIVAATELRVELARLDAIDPATPTYATLVAGIFADTVEGRQAMSAMTSVAEQKKFKEAQKTLTTTLQKAYSSSFFEPSPEEKQQARAASEDALAHRLAVTANDIAVDNGKFLAAGRKADQKKWEKLLKEIPCDRVTANTTYLTKEKATLEQAMNRASEQATVKFNACDPSIDGGCAGLIVLNDLSGIARALGENADDAKCLSDNAQRRLVRAKTDALKEALSEAARSIEVETMQIVRPQGGTRGAGAPLHTMRASGFFSTDIGLGALYANFDASDPGALLPVAFVQVAMSLGRVDFDNGLGSVAPPRRTTVGKWLSWQLLQRLSLNMGLIVNLRPIRSPEGQLTGLFGGTSALGTVGVGFRLTEFLKLNAGVAIGTTQADLPGTGASFHAMPLFGVSLDLPVYRLVGQAFTPVFGPLTELPPAPKPAAGGGT
jgi:hypothetical protein